MTLSELYSSNRPKYPTDKVTRHHYLPVYDKLFTPYRDKRINLLEIGVKFGGSLKLWDDYFTKATIRGIDVSLMYLKCRYSNKVSLELINSNQLTDKYFLGFIPNIVIDDGSHRTEDQIHVIKTVYPVLNGLLIIEDIRDIDKSKGEFDALGFPYEIYDMRFHSKGKIKDDVLLIYRNGTRTE
jgi:hypothetical protein